MMYQQLLWRLVSTLFAQKVMVLGVTGVISFFRKGRMRKILMMLMTGFFVTTTAYTTSCEEQAAEKICVVR